MTWDLESSGATSFFMHIGFGGVTNRGGPKNMSNAIYLIGRGRVNVGKIEAARENLGRVIQDARINNPGILVYEHAVDPKTGAWTGIEKYADNEALKAHLTNPDIGEGLGKFMADLAFDGIVVMGDVSHEVRGMMAGFNPTYLGSSLGFTRTDSPQVVPTR